MAQPILVVLGGYGNTGRACARLLLEHTPARVVVAGRDGDRAAAFAAQLNASHPGDRATWMHADATRAESLRSAFLGATTVVVASSTSAQAPAVAEAVLEAGADYIDPQYSTAKLAALRRLAPAIEAAGRCFVTDGGFHPGLPAALIRFAADRVDQLRSVRVASVIQIDWKAIDLSPATVLELVTEFKDYKSLHYRDRAWRSLGWLESMRPIWVTFGHGFGRRYTMPMFLEELRPLPEMIPSLEEAGFFVGGFNPVVDFVLLPAGIGWMMAAGQRGAAGFGRLLLWGLKRFTPPPYGTLLQLEAEGTRAGRAHRIRVEVAHPDGYVLTAAPMVACVQQMLDGSARRAGLHLQALLVEPARMLDDMRRMGVEVVVQDPA
ncbi:MAG: saccharopine dehydrogenase NADP-binding domain-containing protein [Anaerolineales bacterium]|nr:saccharopine dehydrogenase NADP-binding domain-containing protein [Anaerolineales bacterium]